MIVTSRAKTRVVVQANEFRWDRETRTLSQAEYNLKSDGFHPDRTESFAVTSDDTGRTELFTRVYGCDTEAERVYVNAPLGIELVVELKPWCRD